MYRARQSEGCFLYYLGPGGTQGSSREAWHHDENDGTHTTVEHEDHFNCYCHILNEKDEVMWYNGQTHLF